MAPLLKHCRCTCRHLYVPLQHAVFLLLHANTQAWAVQMWWDLLADTFRQNHTPVLCRTFQMGCQSMWQI